LSGCGVLLGGGGGGWEVVVLVVNLVFGGGLVGGWLWGASQRRDSSAHEELVHGANCRDERTRAVDAIRCRRAGRCGHR
jgi:hypothetical protein